MKKLAEKLPAHVRVLLTRLGIGVLMLFLTRIIFLLFNTEAFPNLGFSDYLAGIWFDIVTVCLFYLPYYALFLLPFNIHLHKAHRLGFKVLFHLINAILLAFNLLDVEYFRYTSKRSTFDLFTTVSTGNDVNQLWTTFLKDFWYLIAFWILLIALTEFLYRRSEAAFQRRYTRHSLLSRGLSMLLIVPCLLVLGRGGFGLKPISLIDAPRYCIPENTAFILNTPFSIVKTIGQESLTPVHFMSDAECEKLFNPIHTSQPQGILPDSTNVVVIVLESFGIEFIGNFQNGKGYTPFLDSLLNQSLSFEYGIANGKRSIEAIPSILASMPTMMEAPYIYSPYNGNKINGLATILKKFGYSSAFYHGATNGTMGFDGFAALAGFEKYVGRKEYDNENHADATWGILDEYFNPWAAREMSKLKQPFIAALFTLSSHHPYFIPEHMKTRVKYGPQPICASLSYGDIALRYFFEEAKKQKWFKNTLFVITADHSPSSSTELYNQRTHVFRVPMAFYHGGGLIAPEKKQKIMQQIDILPTILDFLNISETYYSYGTSHFQQPDGEAFSYLCGSYHYFRDDFLLTFTGDQARNLYNFKTDQMPQVDSLPQNLEWVRRSERRLKAIIQRYNRDLILNQTRSYEKENSVHH